MKIVDLFCLAGGASVGYKRAFPDAEIVGVDIVRSPNYPFEFIEGDIFDLLADRVIDLNEYDLVHASPPCHDHSTATGRIRKTEGYKGTGWMLQTITEYLSDTFTNWVVENVEGAKMPEADHAFRLCGSSFGLDLRRHRKFITNFPVGPKPCDHSWQTPRFRTLDGRRKGALASVVGVHGNINYAGEFPLRCAAMGIDWMTNAELTQAIPPAYCEYIGQQLSLHP